MLGIFCNRDFVSPLQIYYSPRNVVRRISEGLDILHREVCSHLLAPCCHSHSVSLNVFNVEIFPGASCRC